MQTVSYEKKLSISGNYYAELPFPEKNFANNHEKKTTEEKILL